MSEQVDRRVRARERLKKKEELCVKFDERGSIREVKCKGCGVKIAGMMISDAEPLQVMMGGRLTPVVPMEFVHLQNYAEATVEFDDGSAHVTNGCKTCITLLKTMPPDAQQLKLSEWYDEDVTVWMREIEWTGRGDISKENAVRTPRKVK